MEISTFSGFFGISYEWSRYFPLQKYSETFIEPEVLEVPVSDQIPRPAVHYLMYYDIRLASVASLKVWYWEINM